MTKQILIYGDVEPVTNNRHNDLSIKSGENYEFARTTNCIPLVAAEFRNAAVEYTIVFADTADSIIPVVILGLREDENLYINDQGQWTAKYTPAFIRRYPFIFSSSDSGKTFTLCVDEGFSGCNREGRGERLFDVDGQQMQYLTNVLQFLKEYQAQYQRTEAFCQKLKELALLEPMSAQFTTRSGEKINITGFMAIDLDKLKVLTGEQFKELATSDELELIYIHLQSMRNFDLMLERASRTDASIEEIPQDDNEPEPSKKKTTKRSKIKNTSEPTKADSN